MKRCHEVPAALPVIEIPEFHFTKVAPLIFESAGSQTNSGYSTDGTIQSGMGAILYRTTLHEVTAAGTTLKITEVHDWAQVYADGKLLARLDRRKGRIYNDSACPKKGTQLDILVEAMGRVNFDKSIHDRKGITEKVELISGNQSKELKNWTVYNFPVDYSLLKTRNITIQKIVPTMPAYYKSTFNLDKVGDTFLDMSTWGKGMVWVNGHAMGRFGKLSATDPFYAGVLAQRRRE